jgi:hypothetical protein
MYSWDPKIQNSKSFINASFFFQILSSMKFQYFET